MECLLIFLIACGGLSAIIMKNRGGNDIGGFILGFLFGPLGLLLVLLMAPAEHKCPSCKKYVAYGEKICRHCKAELPELEKKSEGLVDKRTRSTINSLALILLIIMVFFYALAIERYLLSP